MSRMTNHRLGAAAVALLAFSLLLPAAPAFAQEPAGETPTVEQLEEQIDALRRELEEMRRERQAAEPAETDDERLAEIERRLEALSAELERVTLGKAVVEPDESFYGLGLSASKVYQVESGLSIGGYGEMLYEGFDSSRDDGTEAFCCLGVLCAVADSRVLLLNNSSVRPVEPYGIDTYVAQELASQNDQGATFTELADYIEKHL